MTMRSRLADPTRRRLVQSAAGALTLAAIGAPAVSRAQTAPKIRIGYWPVASGLPFYAAIEKGYFKEAGLDVEAMKFAGAQQVMEAMLSGRSDGSANGTGSGNLAIGEIASPGLFKIFCANPTNAKYVLDEFIVPKDSPIQSIAELKGKRVGSGPGIQNMTITKAILEKAGATGAIVTELAISQHVAAVAAGQLDACYTLEPTGTVGRLNGTTRVLEPGVVAKYILGDPMAPWFGGSATLTTEFIKKNPDVTKRFIAAYLKGVELVRNQPDEARPFMKGYTAIEGPMTNEVPLAAYTMYNEFTPSDIAYFQKYFDLFTERGVFSSKVDVASLIYKG